MFGLEGRNRDEVMENLYRCLAGRGLIATELDWKNAFRPTRWATGSPISRIWEES